ncbi:2,3,4,5-tetrahydropyridine-2,6-dicarboxylate N-acetyltransferase, partial [Aduncisulcus paluster]
MSQQYDMTNPYEIAKFIKDAKKSTPVKAYVKGDLSGITSDSVRIFGQDQFYVLFGESVDVLAFLEANKSLVVDFELENDRRNSAIPLLDLKYQNARIEPGAMIRDRVAIGDNAVIMMGAVIN